MTTAADPDAKQIERELRAAGSPARAASQQNYLKSSLVFAGTTVPATRAIVIGWRRAHPELTGQRLIEVATALWDGPIFECRLAAVILLTDRRALLTLADAALVERFLRTAGTWALVDGLAADVMGSLVQRFPDLLCWLDRWAADEDFWIRRSAEQVAGWLEARLQRISGVTLREAVRWLPEDQRAVLMAGYRQNRLTRAKRRIDR